MNLEELAEIIERDDQGKEDIEVVSSDVRFNSNGKMVCNSTEFQPTDWGMYKFLTMLTKGVTKTYLDQHPPELWTPLINYDLENSSKKWVLRVRNNELMGVVSQSHYKVFNNSDVIKALIDNIGETSNVHRYHLDDKLFWMRSLYPDGDFMVNDDAYHIGFATVNSEVGFRELTNMGFIYRLACQNDAQMTEESSMKMRHAGHDFDEMSNTLGSSIEAGRQLSQKYVELVRTAADVEIPEIGFNDNLDYVKSELKLSKKATQTISEIYEREDSKTKMGLINSVTHYAANLRGDQRFFMEKGAGSLLEKKFPVEN